MSVCLSVYLCFLSGQDVRLAERIEKEGKACVLVVNKWDTIPDKDSHTMASYELDVRERMRILPWAPIVYTSATTGHRVDRSAVPCVRLFLSPPSLLFLSSSSVRQCSFSPPQGIGWTGQYPLSPSSLLPCCLPLSPLPFSFPFLPS